MRRFTFSLLLLLLVPLAALWLALSDPTRSSAASRQTGVDARPGAAEPSDGERPDEARASHRARRARSRTTTDPRLQRGLDPAAKAAAFFRWSEFRETGFGVSLLACLGDGPMKELDEKLGVDISDRVDQFAVQEEVAIFTGDFGGADFTRLVDGAKPFAYGDRAQLYDPGDGHGGALAVWDDTVVVAGPNANAVEAAIDRLEGRAPTSKLPVLPGHASGTMPAEDFVRLLPVPYATRRALREQLEGAQAWFTVYADDGLHLAVELAHEDPERAREIEEGAAGVLASMPIRGWLPIRHERGVFELDVSAELVRSLMPCARPTL